MDFDYKLLGKNLKRAREQKKLRQADIEAVSHYRIRQPAISAIEHGETRIAVDTLVEYCNACGVRADDVLDDFLTAPLACDSSEAIIDPYVIQLAELLKDCSSVEKKAVLGIAKTIVDLSKVLNNKYMIQEEL